MSNVNDQKILVLKEQIEKKKESLKNKKRFNPITNCSIEIDGVRQNLHALPKEQVLTLLIRLNSFRLSAIDLSLLDEYKISGYKLEEWINDLKARMEEVNQREEEQKLHEMESKLSKLLSEDKKIELEISEIESLLK
jgi:hypothetical protein